MSDTETRPQQKLTPSDLIYAATSRCPCGAGLAHPRNAGPWGDTAYWDCSAILTGTARIDITHEARLPFAYYEIKSEQQPSANGATTRPDEDKTARLDRELAEADAECQRVHFIRESNRRKIIELESEQESLHAQYQEALKAFYAAHERRFPMTASDTLS